MSGGVKQDRDEGTDCGRCHWQRVLRWSGIGAALLGLGLLLLSYGVRTPLVLGHLVAPELAAQAEQRDIDLQIGAISGVGLTGIRLYDVEVGAEASSGEVNLRVGHVDVFPDVSATIRAGHPVIRRIEVDDADVRVSRTGRDVEGSKSGPVSVGESSGLQTWFADELEVIVGSLSVGMNGISQSARLSELELVLDMQRRSILDIGGEGAVAGVGMTLSVEENAIFARFSSTQLADALSSLPVNVSIDGVSVGLEEIGAFVETRQVDDLGLRLHGLEADSPFGGPLTMRAETSTVRGTEMAVRWKAPEAMIDGGQREYALTKLELAYRQDAAGFGFYTEVSDGEGGRVDLEGQWHIPTALVSVNAWFDNFLWDGTMPWPWGDESPVKQATVNGTFHGDIDLVHQLVSLDGEARLRDLQIILPFLSVEPVTFEELQVALPLTLDARGGAASVVGGQVKIGTVAPFGFHGQIVEAGGGSHVFHLAVVGQGIDSAELSRQFPTALTGVIGETNLRGAFGVGMELAGHSAYPESLVMDVNLSGGVQVLEDARWGDWDALMAGDVVTFDSEEHPGKLIVGGEWKGLEDLSDHVPSAVLAAEDTSFFEHDGLDWKGLRMAMVHNIKAGALVRGGSTITQQVAKNLFLTHDRTLSRKLQEAFLTWRVEETMTKEQILELYLNVVEWGPEIHGLYSASYYYFGHEAEELTPVKMAMLASILPSPIRFGGAIKAGYLPSSRESKMRRVLTNMRFLEALSWEEYFDAIGQLDEGRIGELNYEICADDDEAPLDAGPCDEIEVETSDGEEMTFEEWEVAESAVEAGWVPLTH